MSTVRDDARDRQKAYLEAVLAANPGLTLTDIARESGVAPSTLTRVVNDPNATTVLSAPVMAAIEARFGATGEPPGMAEPEVAMIAPPSASAAETLGPDTHLWRVGGQFAGLPGYLPGDVLTASMAVKPAEGDDVILQIEDMRGGATTHLRKFRRGWAFGDSTVEPEYVDGVRVRVAAVVIEMKRSRSAGN